MQFHKIKNGCLKFKTYDIHVDVKKKFKDFFIQIVPGQSHRNGTVINSVRNKSKISSSTCLNIFNIFYCGKWETMEKVTSPSQKPVSEPRAVEK